MKCVGNIESLLSSVLKWLESMDEDENWWQLQTKVAQLCLLELDVTIKALSYDERGGAVVQNVRAMVGAMESRDRLAALAFGKSAVDQLSDL